MLQLIMNQRPIQSLGELYACFSPADMLRRREAFLQAAAPLRLSVHDMESLGHLNLLLLTLLRQQDRLSPAPLLFAHDTLSEAQAAQFPQNAERFRRLIIREKPFDAYCRWIQCLVAESGFLLRKKPQLYQELYDIAWATRLSESEKTELFLLLVCGYRLTNKKSLAEAPITPEEAEAAFLRRPADQSSGDWIALDTDPSVPLVLETRREPYRLLLHPACQSPVETIACRDGSALRARRLPAGCTLRTHRLEAKADPYGDAPLLHLAFYRHEHDPQPLCRSLQPGDHLYLNALHTEQDKPLPVQILPRSVRQGSYRLEAVPAAADMLRFFCGDRELTPFKNNGWVPSFTPVASTDGMIYLCGGRLFAPGCPPELLTALRRLDKAEDLAEVALIDGQVMLLRRNGQVFSQFLNGGRCADGVLSLMDHEENAKEAAL